MSTNPSSAKKKKYEHHGTKNLVQEKLLEVMEAQANERKCLNDNILKGLSAAEAYDDAMKILNLKVMLHTAAIMQCYDQAVLAQEQRIKTLAEIITEFKKGSEDMDSVYKTEVTKLAKAVEDDIEQRVQRLETDAKKRRWYYVRKSIMEAMERDFD